MKRKNLILTILIFLFVNILSIAAENSTTLSDGLSLVDPAFQEALKDYKPNLDNIDKLFNYIEKNIKEKGRAIYYFKLEREKNEVIVTDENKLEKLSQEAIKQIEEKKYDVNLKTRGIENITLVGIAFYRKKLKVSYK